VNILHLSFFYPDEVESVTTHAIKNLIDCAATFAWNHCFSFHMKLPIDRVHVRKRTGHTIICHTYRTFPYGMRRFLQCCAESVRAELADTKPIDLVHAHMLTMEGVLALDIKQRFGIQYVVSVRATDFILFRFKPYLKHRYLQVVDEADRLILISPWMATALERVFGSQWTAERKAKIAFLYNVVDGPQYWHKENNGRYAMPIVPHQNQLGRKSVAATLRAISRLRREGYLVQLDIFGEGSGLGRIADWIALYRLSDLVTLKGNVPNRDMIATLQGYKALFLCSRPETFGLVYIEALKAGIPIVHMTDTGIDGLFPNHDIGLGVQSRSTRCLAEAFRQMDRKHALCKDEVFRLQVDGGLEPFSRQAMQAKLHDIYSHAVGTAAHEVDVGAATYSGLQRGRYAK
jgi:glycosyltransferase involved in cell wall biosynthesis